MKYIVLDLEATCWEEKNVQPNEIIEIGAVCIDDDLDIAGEIDLFVKPKVHPELSSFCKKLTTISQKMVDDAPLFPEALKKFQDWIKKFDDDYILCSWGFYDKTQFKNDCQLHNLDTRWLKNHISLKHQYADIKGIKGVGMPAALKMEGLTMEGTHHRGIDDAKNIAKIFMTCFDEWEFPI